jgi:hypothetical protein
MVDEYVTHWLGGGITSVGLWCCGWDLGALGEGAVTGRTNIHQMSHSNLEPKLPTVANSELQANLKRNWTAHQSYLEARLKVEERVNATNRMPNREEVWRAIAAIGQEVKATTSS